MKLKASQVLVALTHAKEEPDVLVNIQHQHQHPNLIIRARSLTGDGGFGLMGVLAGRIAPSPAGSTVRWKVKFTPCQ
ncbi:unnamed protein product [Arctogadus glacialis]